MLVPFGTSSPLTLCRDGKYRAMGCFCTLAQQDSERAELEQWIVFADKPQAPRFSTAAYTSQVSGRSGS